MKPPSCRPKDAELVERTGVAAELLLVVLTEECQRQRIWQDPADGRYRILYGSIDANTSGALVEIAERWLPPRASSLPRRRRPDRVA
jgi:hypothetical protein